jgi:hypothetical protein
MPVIDELVKNWDEERLQAQLSKALLQLRPETGIGTAASFLLLMAARQPDMVRRVLNEKVIKQGFVGVSLLDKLQHIAK